MRMTRWSAVARMAAGVLLLSGCASVKVRDIESRDYHNQRRGDLLSWGRPSNATRESLLVLGLRYDACRTDPTSCLNHLASADGLSEERRLSAIAEVWLGAAIALDEPVSPSAKRREPGAKRREPGAKQRELGAKQRALGAYVEAARASYAYLFFTGRTPGERAFEDRQTQVRDFYNFATERVVCLFFERRLSGDIKIEASGRRVLRTGSWTLYSVPRDLGLPRGSSLPDELISSSRLRFGGLSNTYRRDGFGAEFVAVAAEDPVGIPSPSSPVREAHYVAVSAVLCFPGDTIDEILAAREATIEAYDPRRTERLHLPNTDVPLAANFTAPYALWLARSGFGGLATQALFLGSEALTEPRVYLLQPYDPQRKTVIMLHGLASSPEAWINLANEVLGDPALRERYQIWQVFYPTSLSISENQIAIRNALNETLRELDPSGLAPASRDIVLIGHSMGGVISRLLVCESGDRIWNELVPGMTPEQRVGLAVVEPYFTLRHLPQVSRAVFVASPHRGAPLALSVTGRLARRLVRTPARLIEATEKRAKALETIAPDIARLLRHHVPTSIDQLSERHPYLHATWNLPIADGVTYHSIIGCVRPGTALHDCSDSLVPYTSAHLEGAASELIVTSSHSVQETAPAILEIRRILHQHLAADEQAKAFGK